MGGDPWEVAMVTLPFICIHSKVQKYLPEATKGTARYQASWCHPPRLRIILQQEGRTSCTVPG